MSGPSEGVVRGGLERKPLLSGGLMAMLFFAAMLLAVVWSVSTVRGAEQSLDDARARFSQIADDSRRIIAARQRDDAMAPSGEPDSDVLALLAQAMNEAQLPSSRQQQVSSGGEIRVASGGGGPASPEIRETRVNIKIQPIEPDELWRLLRAWRAMDTPWTPVSLTIESTGRTAEPTYGATLVVGRRYAAPSSR